MVRDNERVRLLDACFQYSLCRVVLMVPIERLIDIIEYAHFQYSLCRVVLMVTHCTSITAVNAIFQYSLCRVVLMVVQKLLRQGPRWTLSVLALSSRFDGRSRQSCAVPAHSLSVLALSSRFDGHPDLHWLYDVGVSFSTRSVESF